LVECKGRRVIFKSEEMVLPNGHRMLVDKVIFPDAVAVLPVYRDGRVVLIRQYRPVVNDYILEAPAGVIDKGETPEDAARRELEEETGLKAGELVYLGEGYTSPGYSTERLYLYMALDPEEGSPHPEAHEIINLEMFNIGDLVLETYRGGITDIKTIALIHSAYNWLKERGLL
jgi:ADP-ribose pyrophosphatase